MRKMVAGTLTEGEAREKWWLRAQARNRRLSPWKDESSEGQTPRPDLFGELRSGLCGCCCNSVMPWYSQQPWPICLSVTAKLQWARGCRQPSSPPHCHNIPLDHIALAPSLNCMERLFQHTQVKCVSVLDFPAGRLKSASMQASCTLKRTLWLCLQICS